MYRQMDADNEDYDVAEGNQSRQSEDGFMNVPDGDVPQFDS